MKVTLKSALHGAWQKLDRIFGNDVFTLKTILMIMFPLFIDQLSLSAMTVINSAMISSTGTQAVSAVSTIDTFSRIPLNFIAALAIGSAVCASQYAGRKHAAVEQGGGAMSPQTIVAQSIRTITFLSVLITALILLGHDLVINGMYAGLEPEVSRYSSLYLIYSCLSLPMFAVVQSVSGCMRGFGRTSAALVLSFLMIALNLFFNVLLLVVFRLGVLGISLALLLSRACTAVFAIVMVLRSKRIGGIAARDLLQCSRVVRRQIIRIGVPAGIEQALFHAGKILTQVFVISFGTAAIAANAIAGSLVQFLLIPANTIQLGVVTLVGQLIGAGRPKQAKRMVTQMTLLCMASLAVMSVVTVLLRGPLIAMYHQPEAISALSLKLLYLFMGFGLLFWPISFVPPSGLRAAGDVVYTTIIAILSMWLFRVVLGWFLGVYYHLGVEGIWISMGLEWIVRGTLFSVRYRGNKWYTRKLTNE